MSFPPLLIREIVGKVFFIVEEVILDRVSLVTKAQENPCGRNGRSTSSRATGWPYPIFTSAWECFQ